MIRLLLLMMLCLPVGAAAEDPPPFPEFTFKKIAPPTRGAARRITVQIGPQAPPDADAPVDAPQPDVALPDVAFWDAVGTGGSDLGPARLAVALAALRPRQDPALAQLQPLAEAHGRAILAATIDARVSPALILAVMAVESGGKSDAVSRAGAQGLMQLMPVVSKALGLSDPFDPTENIAGGARVLARLLAQYDGDPVLTLAAYNAGAGAIRDAKGVPAFPETRAYVPKVLAAWRTARSLCLTPPDFVTDPCVFATQGIR